MAQDTEPFTFGSIDPHAGIDRVIDFGFHIFNSNTNALLREWWKMSGCEWVYGPLNPTPADPAQKPPGYYFRLARR